jgi:hypothetical protein
MAGTGIAYPADASGGTPLYTATQGRSAFSATLAGATAARPLGGISGVRPGTPTNTVTATTTTWTAAAFAGTIDLHTLATNGPYFFSFPAGGTGTVVAQIATTRQDIIWVRIDDSNTGDGSGTRQVVIDYSAGTLTPPARAFVIAIINNTATGGGAPSVTWVAPYTVAAGGIGQINTFSQFASQYSNPVQNTLATTLDTGITWQYYALYNVSTNSGGAKTAGWYPAAGQDIWIRMGGSASAASITGNVDNVQNSNPAGGPFGTPTSNLVLGGSGTLSNQFFSWVQNSGSMSVLFEGRYNIKARVQYSNVPGVSQTNIAKNATTILGGTTVSMEDGVISASATFTAKLEGDEVPVLTTDVVRVIAKTTGGGFTNTQALDASMLFSLRWQGVIHA